MDAAVKTKTEDKFVTVAGLRTRYIEQGQGPAVILLHGASLGSSADVWRRNLGPLADFGLRVIAYDQPGFGLSDDPPEWGIGFRTDFILKFMDALGIEKATLVGHSQAGNMAVELALAHPDRVEKLIALGTGSLLPPLPESEKKKAGPAEGEEGGDTEPTLADVRDILAKNTFHQELITDEILQERLRMSTGKNFKAFLARNAAGAKNKGKPKDPNKKAAWQRLGEVKQPFLLIYGRDDRAKAGKRAEQLKQQQPTLNLHIVPNCKHIVQWDAEKDVYRLAGPFLRD
jgi:2-hydroxy-6-oxonona-2,4-dienedioate hydrolase/4,5:9,10-diseco-3-hydroxy-5,9,17-trioxoandrosta-1(10),2-diene-4-oate hydrolase